MDKIHPLRPHLHPQIIKGRFGFLRLGAKEHTKENEGGRLLRKTLKNRELFPHQKPSTAKA